LVLYESFAALRYPSLRVGARDYFGFERDSFVALTIPEQSTKRQMWRAESISRRSRVMASNRRKQRESRCETDAEGDVDGSGAGARVGGRDGWGDGAAGYWEAPWHGWRVRMGGDVSGRTPVMIFDGGS
jgi:hypothetical protein